MPNPLLGFCRLPRFIIHWIRYASAHGAEKVGLLELQPCLGDWNSHTPFDAHYFYQGAWLARRMCAGKTAIHVDIGSSVLLLSVLSAQIDTVFVDFRPLKASLHGLRTIAGSILNLPFSDNSLGSLSSLHVIEHIGLGRYGEPFDPFGSIKAALELQRVVFPGGSLFVSLPIGRERVCFNAHRIHSPTSVLSLFPAMELVEFSYVDDAGKFYEHCALIEGHNLEYGCGMFHFRKL